MKYRFCNSRFTYHFSGVCLFLWLFSLSATAQFLSNLNATRASALYTTYCAPIERSAYKLDQGYQFQWADEESGIEFISADGPNSGLAFMMNNRLLFRLREMYKEPVITVSYSDLVRYHYYPVRDLRVEVFFAVYSSGTAMVEYSISNEGVFPVSFSLCPYIYLPSGDSAPDFNRFDADFFSFELQKKRDGWMKEHQIPLVEQISGTWSISGLNSTTGTNFIRSTANKSYPEEAETFDELIASSSKLKRKFPFVKGLIRNRNLTMQPGDQTSFRVFIDLKEKTDNKKVLHNDVARISGQIIPDSLIKADERIYSRIPLIRFGDPDRAMLYWSAFSLMRQCMMPPEGACRKNYYVFSREPKWGWGYGGQVFHESLVMLAYAYMDPESAMNSQRVYMDRQRDDGYINYRTGPYLDETIETNGQPTSSAPWYNYQNLEVWKITKDRGFLKEAYASGKRFYQYYTARRDSNQNGLCEWGGHAELESVRDARVATWDQVGWASNFEGPDVNSMLVSEAQALAEMAAALGLKQESEAWERDAATRGKKINEKMWDPESGFYFNISKNDQAFTFKTRDDLKIREIIGFLPMWAGVTDRQQISLLVSNLMDTNTFWRRYGVPSLSAAHAYYCPIGYWNGPVWVQWNYLIYQGLKSYGYHSEASELTNRVVDNMVFHLKTDHTFWEFYSADDHHAGWNKTYIWAGIVARFLIDEHKNLIK